MNNEIDARNKETTACERLANAIFGVKDMADSVMNSGEHLKTEEEQVQIIATLKEVLKTLRERERQVVMARFGLNGGCVMSYEQLADQMNMSKEEVRDIEAVAFRKLRHPSRSRRLKRIIDGTD